MRVSWQRLLRAELLREVCPERGRPLGPREGGGQPRAGPRGTSLTAAPPGLVPKRAAVRGTERPARPQEVAHSRSLKPRSHTGLGMSSDGRGAHEDTLAGKAGCFRRDGGTMGLPHTGPCSAPVLGVTGAEACRHPPGTDRTRLPAHSHQSASKPRPWLPSPRARRP